MCIIFLINSLIKVHSSFPTKEGKEAKVAYQGGNSESENACQDG